MPGAKFKPQYKRLLFITGRIRDGRYPNCAKLAAEWEVSAKTIQRDIDYLKYELDAPIEYDRVRHGFYYMDKTWVLPSLVLSEGDIFAILIGAQALDMYKGTPVAAELKSIYTRLAEMLPDKVSIAPELIFNRLSFLNPPSRPVDAGVWKSLIRGLLHQRVTTIRYLSTRSDEPKVHEIHPLHVANIEGDWYVFAFEPRWNDIAQFAISRIKEVRLADTLFAVPAGFDVQRLMKDRFGKFVHTKPTGRVTVRVLLSPDIAPTMAERIWHPRQRLAWRKKGAAELAFPVADVQDVLPWVLSLGSNATVLAPTSLRRLVAKEAAGMCAAGRRRRGGR